MFSSWLNQLIGLIDTLGYGHRGTIAAYVVRGHNLAALVDVGYSTCGLNVLRGLLQLGVKPEAVRYIFITHPHLDHVGALSYLIQYLTNATVVIHEDAIRFLIDPSRLVDSTRALFGEDLSHLIGSLEPIQPERIEPAKEEAYELNGLNLRIIFTPGHMPTHISIAVEEASAILTGDAVAVSTESLPALIPPASPPMFDVEAALSSLHKIRSFSPRLLLRPHFGPLHPTDEFYDANVRAIEWFMDEVAAMMSEGLRAEQIAEALRRKILDKVGLSKVDDYAEKILLGKLLFISVLGYMGFLLRKR